jgi:DNA gyrase subunit B
MYVGDVTDGSGLHHLLWEVVDDVVDAHSGGYASELRVELGPDGWVSVHDDGPGVPTDPLPARGAGALVAIAAPEPSHPDDPTTALEAVFMRLCSGSRWSGGHVTSGLHGVGLAVVNALSERLEIETTYDGVRWTQAFERGERACTLRRVGPSTRAGTTIRFRPDAAIFERVVIDHDRVRRRLYDLSWLYPHLRVWFQEQRIVVRGGVAGWARRIAAERGDVIESSSLTYALGGIQLEIGFAWNRDGAPVVRSYVNLHPSTRGSHIDGLWLGFQRWARAVKSPAREIAHVREAVGCGLVAVMHVRMVEPRFTSQTRDVLCSPPAAKAVRDAVAAARHPDAWHTWRLRSFVEARLRVPTDASD